MPLYVHRPTLVEAVELQQDMVINTPEGPRPGRKGDFLITIGVSQKQYPIERHIFYGSYLKYKDGMDVYVPDFEDDLRDG